MHEPHVAASEAHFRYRTQQVTTTVVESRVLAPSAYHLIVRRNEFVFQAGMVVTIHGSDPLENRDYTICSGMNDHDLHILYRYIPTGRLTSKLVQLKVGDSVEMSGPFGQFVVRDPTRPSVFIATGTGIAPCRSYVRSHPSLPLTILHGARRSHDLFFANDFRDKNYFPCVSQEFFKGFQGRVTDRLSLMNFDTDTHYYLCGAYEMIYDVSTLLKERGVPPSHIFTEAYYYQAGA